jgi:hypothetical protein
MARRSGFVHTLVKAQHDAERRRAAQLRQQVQLQTQAAKAADKARKDYERAQQADQQVSKSLYQELRRSMLRMHHWSFRKLFKGWRTCRYFGRNLGSLKPKGGLFARNLGSW